MTTKNQSCQQAYQQNLRKCIDKVSESQKYQKLLIIYMCILWLQITFSAMIGSYVFMNPLFQCQGGRSVTQVQACQILQSDPLRNCRVTNDFTATFYSHLYCEGKNKRSAIQSIFAVGAIIGMFGLPALADSKGRRFSFLVAFWLQIIGISLMVFGVYCKYFVPMLIGQLLAGIQASGMVILTYVITSEFCKDSIKQSAFLFYCAFWGVGEICFFFFYNYMPQWDHFLVLVILIPSLGLTAISHFFIMETPQYCLLMAKDIKKFNQTIDQLSLYNDSSQQSVYQIKKLAKNYLIQIQKQQQGSKSSQTFSSTMKKILTQRQFVTPCLCLALVQLSYNIFYYGVQGSLERTGYNFGLSMLLIGLHEFIAYITTSYVIQKVRRKRGLIFSIIITCGFGLTFLFDAVNNNSVLQSIVVSITRIGCVYSYSFISILETESFPANIKSTAIGLTVGLSQVGRVAVPFLITAVNDVGIHPLIVSSICYLALGMLPLIPVKQTFKINNKKNQAIKQSLLNDQVDQK